MKKTILYLITLMLLVSMVSAGSIKPTTIKGDLNNDHITNSDDAYVLFSIINGYGGIYEDTLGFCKADIDQNRVLDLRDVFAIFRGQAQGECAPLVLSDPRFPLPYPIPVPIPSYPEVHVKGDINGDGILHYEDTELIADASAGVFRTNPEIVCRADLNSDGAITIIDSLLARQFIERQNPLQTLRC